jgi:hypothetical protein
MTFTKTTGTALVICWRAATGEFPLAKMTFGTRATNSAAPHEHWQHRAQASDIRFGDCARQSTQIPVAFSAIPIREHLIWVIGRQIH